MSEVVQFPQRAPPPKPEMSIEERLRRIRRTAEMSAAIMRDRQRTGGWKGAENVARSFDRLQKLATIGESND